LAQDLASGAIVGKERAVAVGARIGAKKSDVEGDDLAGLEVL